MISKDIKALLDRVQRIQSDHTKVGVIKKIVADEFNVSINKITSNTRKQKYVYARNIAFMISRDLTTLSLSNIGLHFNRDHATIIHSTSAIIRDMDTDAHLHDKYKKCYRRAKQYLK